jgi:hypothetical protein
VCAVFARRVSATPNSKRANLARPEVEGSGSTQSVWITSLRLLFRESWHRNSKVEISCRETGNERFSIRVRGCAAANTESRLLTVTWGPGCWHRWGP